MTKKSYVHVSGTMGKLPVCTTKAPILDDRAGVRECCGSGGYTCRGNTVLFRTILPVPLKGAGIFRSGVLPFAKGT